VVFLAGASLSAAAASLGAASFLGAAAFFGALAAASLAGAFSLALAAGAAFGLCFYFRGFLSTGFSASVFSLLEASKRSVIASRVLALVRMTS
jgi:hypothetical protein